ncbi:MAG TPA: D-hexose-6-phosphate mutarotase [Gemmatimonadaceae bacterium]
MLEHPAGGRAEISLHGAHVLSWTRPGGDEMLFLSRRAVFDVRSAIRGGVPVIFPQFGPGPLPKHGFARTARWTLAELRADRSAAHARLALRDDDATRAVWPHPFHLELEATLDDCLTMRLSVANPGGVPFAFTAALHTYLRVADAGRARLVGLRGVRYIDKVRGGAHAIETADAVTIAEPVDRIYLEAPRSLRLDDVAGGRAIEIVQEGFRDTVVWNPWADGVASLPDMAPDEWRAMLCVEAAAAGDPVRVAPGGTWSGTQRLRAIPTP